MPQITVDYSDSLSRTFDRRGFALALHPLTAGIIDTDIETCKTRFRRVDEAFVADGAPGHAVIHVELAILPGRTGAMKAELSEAVLELVRRHAAFENGVTVHASVDVTELGDAYRKHTAG